MDDSEYKRLCAQPDVMRRSEIRATVNLLQSGHSELAGRVATLLNGPPLPKPSGHSGSSDSDFLYLDLEPDYLDEIVNALGDLEASLSEADVPDPTISLAGGLLDRWNNAESSRPAV